VISVVVAAKGRPLRLRWLLNALQEQEGPAFEVLVGTGDEASARVAASHPVVTAHRPAARATPGSGRNAVLPLARGELVAFIDDDCRPAPGWLAALAAGPPGAILQGRTKPDPDELGKVALRGWRSQDIEPPTPWGQCCNIAYPRALLQPFDEALEGGEDADLLHRAGGRAVAVPDALVWHAVEVLDAPRRARAARRWRHLPAVVRRHPRMRRGLVLGVFQTRRHAALWLALLVRRPWAWLPWAVLALPSYGPHPRGRARAVAELPAELLDDLVEVAWLVRGSVEHRSPVL
jgi:glycosyltransferase involved in cell wall biosynthesis